MRDEVVLSRAEPLGGGGYPLSGQQRNDQFVSGEIAWNQAGTTATPGPRFVTDRMHQLWITPHGVLKAAQRNGATRAARGDGGATAARRSTQPGRFSATADHRRRRPRARGSTRPSPTRCSATRARSRPTATTATVGGVQFPMRVRQTIGGYPVLDLAVTEVQANAVARARRARRGAQPGRARDLREGGRRRLVRRRRLAQQRRDRAGATT